MKPILIIVCAIIVLGAAAYGYFVWLPENGVTATSNINASKSSAATSTKQIVSSDLWPKGFPQGLPAEYRGRVVENYNVLGPVGQIMQSTRVYWSAKSVADISSSFKNYFSQNFWETTEYQGSGLDKGALRAVRGGKSAEIVLVTNANQIWFDDNLAKSLPEIGEKTLVYVSFWEDKNLEPIGQMDFPGSTSASQTSLANSALINATSSQIGTSTIKNNTAPAKVYNQMPLRLTIPQIATSTNKQISLGQEIDLSWQADGLSLGSKYSIWIWCSQNSSETDLNNLPQADKAMGSTYNGNIMKLTEVCSYQTSGSHILKVIVVSGNNMGEARQEVTVAAKTYLNQDQNGTAVSMPDPAKSCIFQSSKIGDGKRVVLNWSCPSKDYICTISPPVSDFSGVASGTVVLAPRWDATYNLNCSNGVNLYTNSTKVQTGNPGT